MTAWTTLTDASLSIGKPLTYLIARAFRDNVLALAEGAAGAPAIAPGAIGIGGSGVDGSMGNGFSFSGPGFYDFTDITLSTSKTFPYYSVIRSQGNVTISSTITIDNPVAAEFLANTSTFPTDLFALSRGPSGSTAGYGSAGAGGNGTGGHTGGVANPLVTCRYFQRQSLKAIFGGATSFGSYFGGGALILIADGNVTLTGATISANGQNGSVNAGGAGGGSIIIISSGTITGGTLNCVGGNGNTGGGTGGGGGGLVGRYAPTVTGGTVSVAGGAGNGAGNPGSAGINSTLTGLTPGQIRTLVRGI
jgi:hypothetical protein